MDNTRVEQLISRKGTSLVMLMKVMTILGAAILSFISFALLLYYGLVFSLLIIYFASYVLKMSDIEYEYLLVNNEFTIDVIYGKRKRKHCCSFDVKDAEVFAPLESDKVKQYLDNNNISGKDYTSGDENGNIYVMVVKSEGKLIKVFIEPNEKLFDGIKTYIPRKTFTA